MRGEKAGVTWCYKRSWTANPNLVIIKDTTSLIRTSVIILFTVIELIRIIFYLCYYYNAVDFLLRMKM